MNMHTHAHGEPLKSLSQILIDTVALCCQADCFCTPVLSLLIYFSQQRDSEVPADTIIRGVLEVLLHYT